MKKFKIGSYQLTETKKWAPCGTLFEFIEGDKMKITEADVFPPEYRFDTEEEADEFFREHFLKEGYIEDIES
ncbi:MAG: hypothetical protein KAR24_02890 [Candidatus Pacebacteria bacterium]|nr:hypothetical protein [Candidatus Paceibacterota bacterium]